MIEGRALAHDNENCETARDCIPQALHINSNNNNNNNSIFERKRSWYLAAFSYSMVL